MRWDSDGINGRADEMWRYISRRVDFRDKYVLDIGCGYGDFLWRSIIAGANHVFGFDLDKKFDTDCTDIIFIEGDANTLQGNYKFLPEPDIVICFDLLPYLTNPVELLKWMSKFQESLIEFPYIPEPHNIGIDSDDGAQRMLEWYWSGVEKLGSTHIESRNVDRAIWNCYGGWS